MSDSRRKRRKAPPGQGYGKPRHERQQHAPKGFWESLAKVVMLAIHKNALVPLGVLSLFLVVAWRLPEQQLGELILKLVDQAVAVKLLGWALFLLTIVVWFYHARLMRRRHSADLRRVGEEKSRLQAELAGYPLPSSDLK